MITIYNHTDLSLKLKSANATGETSLNIMDANDSSKCATIIKATNTQIIEVVNNRYQNERMLEDNPAREYILIRNSRILVDPVLNEFVISTTESTGGKLPKNLVKNMLVLVMHKQDRFVANSVDLKKKPTIISFGDDYIVVLLHITRFNWSNLQTPIQVYIKAAENSGRQTKMIDLTYKTVAGRNGNDYNQNIAVVSDYAGEVPSFVKPSTKPAGDRKPSGRQNGGYSNSGYNNSRSSHSGARGNTKNYNYGPSERIERQNSERVLRQPNKKDLVIPKYQDNSSRTQGGRKKQYNGKRR